MNGERQRLFFALWPPESLRAEMVSRLLPLLEEVRGRRVPAANWHVTLAFLGAVGADARCCLETAATGIKTAPFELVLDHLHYIRRSGIIWLWASVVPAGLEALAGGLLQAQRDCGLLPESRPFRAHMTLMRDAKTRDLPTPVSPMRWTVDDFVLVESQTLSAGAQYTVLQRYPLEPPT